MKRIFTNGSFDVIHSGHLTLLEHARSLGDCLHVAIDSDARIASRKGASRPFHSQQSRAHLLSSIRWVDSVSIFNSDSELEETIKEYAPDVMVVGSDWRGLPIVGGRWAKRIEYFERIPGYSTTSVLSSYVSRLSETIHE
jgi:D-beta-D-heptose 7-phosphate kinase/D-beta-D-heptose 1-phosphate adenosyltransferase